MDPVMTVERESPAMRDDLGRRRCRSPDDP
jgi:hypothetical protein